MPWFEWPLSWWERQYAWIDDEQQVLEVARDLLIAVGVGDSTVQRFDSVLGHAAALTEFSNLRAVGSNEPESDERRSLVAMAPAELDAFLDLIIDVEAIASAVLHGLRTHRIRPELIGVGSAQIEQTLADLRRLFDSPHWRARDARAIEDDLEDLLVHRRYGTEAVPPEPGEVGRLVGVLRSLPRTTLRKITPVRNPLLLGRLIKVGLHLARSELALGTAPGEERAPRYTRVVRRKRDWLGRWQVVEETITTTYGPRRRGSSAPGHRG